MLTELECKYILYTNKIHYFAESSATALREVHMPSDANVAAVTQVSFYSVAGLDIDI